MTRIFGDFIEIPNTWREYVKIGFSMASIPLQQRWRTNGLSADFLADYLCMFFPAEDKASLDRQFEIKDAISYIANELLENAMKFSYAPSQHAVSIDMYLEKDVISLYVTNSVNSHLVKGFQRFIQRLLTQDIDALYMEQLSRSTEEATGSGSGLGFLTMLNNYGAKLAWKFASLAEAPDVVRVTTLVRLTV